MYKRLRSIRRNYPIQLYFGDFEHLTSQIKIPDMRYYHRLATRMLDHYLLGKKRRPRFDVRSAPTLCDPEAFGPVVRVKNWGALHPDELEFDLPGPQMTGSPIVDPRGGPTTDHVVIGLQQRGCVTTDQPETPGVATWRVPIERDFTLLGMPRLELAYEATGTDIQLNSRLWDVAPDGVQTLVTRGAYRVVGPGAGEQKAAYDLYGNHWRFEKGHELLLEVTGDDSTFFRRDNFPSVITVNSAKLTLPGMRMRRARHGAGAGGARAGHGARGVPAGPAERPAVRRQPAAELAPRAVGPDERPRDLGRSRLGALDRRGRRDRRHRRRRGRRPPGPEGPLHARASTSS